MGVVFPQGEARKSQLMEIARMAHEPVPTMPDADEHDVTLTATDVKDAKAPRLLEKSRRTKRALMWAAVVGTLALVAAIAIAPSGNQEKQEAVPVEAQPETSADHANPSGEALEAVEPDEAEAATPKVQKAARARAKPAVKGRPGTIDLVTRGGWAEVYKGKKLLGSTPRRLTLPAGRHKLVLKPFGDGKPKTVVVTVEAGKRKKVSVHLD
jgi:hypothetical protein